MNDYSTHHCNSCNAPAKNRCIRCKEVYYCSRECQRIEWRVHKKRCKEVSPKPSSEDGKNNSIKKPVPKEVPEPRNTTILNMEDIDVSKGEVKASAFNKIAKGMRVSWTAEISKEWAYLRFIESYRLRLAEDNEAGYPRGIFKHENPLESFKYYIECCHVSQMFPTWWTDDDTIKMMGIAEKDGWATIYNPVPSNDIKDKYTSDIEARILRVMATQIYEFAGVNTRVVE